MNRISKNLLRPHCISILTVISLCLLLFSPSPVLGQYVDYYWVGGSGSTTDPMNWSLTPGGPGGAGVPDYLLPGSNANIILSDGIDRIITDGVAGIHVVVGEAGTGNVNMSGYLFSNNGSMTIDATGTGNINISGTLFSHGGPLTVDATGAGNINISGNMTTGNGDLTVDATGTGIVTLSGGISAYTGVLIGQNTSAMNIVLNGGIGSADNVVRINEALWNNAGSYADHSIIISNSIVNVTSLINCVNGPVNISNSTVNISEGGGIKAFYGVTITGGTVNQTGGTVNGNVPGLHISSATYNLSGTGVINGGNFPGDLLSISGTFNQTGGQVTGGQISTNMSGTYNLEGGSLNLLGMMLSSSNTNTGSFNYKGGSFSITGVAPFTNNGTTTLSGSGTRIVDGNVVNNGTWKVTNTTAVYTGTFTNNGAYNSDPSKNYFNNLTIGSTGYLTGGAGDEFHIGGDFLNYSTNPLWNTNMADLFFGSGTHTFFVGETGKLIWDDLTLDPTAILILQGGADLYVDELNFVSLSEFTGVGSIYFQDLNHTGISGVFNIPEPATMLLLGLGLIGLAGLRRKFQK